MPSTEGSTGKGMAGSEFLLVAGDFAPGGGVIPLFDGMASFAAVVFAIGEGVIFGRHALREMEDA